MAAGESGDHPEMANHFLRLVNYYVDISDIIY
jgi:hypothetical protein